MRASAAHLAAPGEDVTTPGGPFVHPSLRPLPGRPATRMAGSGQDDARTEPDRHLRTVHRLAREVA